MDLANLTKVLVLAAGFLCVAVVAYQMGHREGRLTRRDRP